MTKGGALPRLPMLLALMVSGCVDGASRGPGEGAAGPDAGATHAGRDADVAADAEAPPPDAGDASVVSDAARIDLDATGRADVSTVEDGSYGDAALLEDASASEAAAYPEGRVTLVASSPCGEALCHDLHVSCEGLEDWGVSVRETEVDQARGAVLFGTGGPANTFYFDNAARRSTRQVALEEKLEVFEFRWSPSWIRAGEITGDIRATHCVYAATVDWIASSRADAPGTLCAQGNSAASFQIAYGLVAYNLELRLDMAILTGGPPLTRMDYACFDTDPAGLLVFPDDLAGRRWIDVGMGWESEAYCQRGEGPPDVHARLQAASIVSPSVAGDYHYPDTRVHFVSSEEDIQGSFGALFYDAIETEKSFQWLAAGAIDGNPHEVDLSSAGMEVIQALLREDCR